MLIIKKFSLILFFIVSLAQAEYIEGVDTTDMNGYNRDSTFSVTPTRGIQGAYVRYFHQDGDGYFNYTFDEIKMAPNHPKQINLPNQKVVSYCFVVKKTKDSTYTKVQILGKLPDNRFVFKYGANNTPNDRVLEKPDYDRSLIYKPNNVYHKDYYILTFFPDTISWDPPLPNNNHLIGYIYYSNKANVTIDTTAPINPAQWDSIAFVDSSKNFMAYGSLKHSATTRGGWYYNVVAVYAEGKSDFLHGWTNNYNSAVNIQKLSLLSSRNDKTIKIQQAPGAITFLLPFLCLEKSMRTFSIFSPSGRELKRLSNEEIQGNRFVWKAPEGVFNAGMYIAKAQLSDKSVSQTFIITR